MTDILRRDIFNDANLQWHFHKASTRELTHSIHRYSGKFIPQIARQAIELLTDPGDLVLDPYAGSGTTLLEAMMSGRRAIGVDLNPLAVLIATTKVTPVERRLLTKLMDGAMAIHFEGVARNELDLWPTSVVPARPYPDPLKSEWFTKWFPGEVIESLSAIKFFADSQEDERLRNIALVAMSDILRKVSRAHQGFPNVMFDKKRTVSVSVRDEFLSRLRDITNAVARLDDATSAIEGLVQPKVIHGRAEDRNVPDDSVDAVISHPPYIGSVPYAEYGMLSLKWLGAEPKELDAALTGGKRQSKDVVARFYEGYEGMLTASTRAIRPGGNIFLLTGNPTVKGQVIDLNEMTTAIAKLLGLTLRYTAERSGVNRRANRMDIETVTVWVKS